MGSHRDGNGRARERQRRDTPPYKAFSLEPIPTLVRIDNDASEEYTVIEIETDVSARDAPPSIRKAAAAAHDPAVIRCFVIRPPSR